MMRFLAPLTIALACVGCAQRGPGADTVEIAVGGGAQVVLAKYRNTSGGAWLDPKPTRDGYELAVDDDYVFVSVCATAYGDDVQEIEATVADGPQTSCSGPATPAAPTGGTSQDAIVSGTMKQPGTLALGDRASTSTTPDWTWATSLPDGTVFDLLAISSTDQALLERDLTATVPETDLPTVDVTSGGVALVSAPVLLPALDSDELVFARDDSLATAHGSFTLPWNDAAALLLPSSALAAADQQQLSILIASATGTRSATWTATGPAAPPAALPLLPRLRGVQLGTDRGGISAAFLTPAASIDELTLGSATRPTQQGLTVTAGWLAANGRPSQVALDTSAPGFDPAWMVSDVPADQLGFAVSRHDPATGVDQLSSNLAIADATARLPE